MERMVMNRGDQGRLEGRNYPPSILLLAARSEYALKVKRALEGKGCQVCQIDPGSECLSQVSRKYFDLIVLDMDPALNDNLAGYRQLQAHHQLANIPTVLMTSQLDLNQWNLPDHQGELYLLAREAPVIKALLPLIEQIHYLSYRYLGLTS